MMERWKKNLLLLWISQILVVVGYAAALPFIPLFISERYGITDDRTLGLIVSWFHFVSTGSFAVMAPIWGRLADRYGRKLMLLRACFMDAIIFPLMVYAPNMTVLFILRILASIFTGTTSAAQPLIVSGTPKERHGFALGLLSTALWSGNMLGYLFGGLIVNYFGFTAAFMFCGGAYLLSGIIVLFVHEDFKPVARREKQSGGGVFSLGASVWIVLSLILLLGFIRYFEMPYLPQLAKRIVGEKTAAFWTGNVSAAAALGGVLAGALCGYLADKTSANKIILPALVLGCAAVLWQAYATSIASLIVARFFAYLAVGGIGPIFLTLITKITAKEKQGLVFGLNTTAENTGIMLSTLFSGGVIYYAGVRGVYTIAALLYLLFIPYVIFANTKIKHKP
ncbi:MAG: MFS transporter [Victivallales bacterium]|nr:MFS transporter [Victivallales bacterium]